jgi:hypothetical protein
MSGDLDLVRRIGGAEHGLAIVSVARADASVHTSLVNAGVLDDPVTGDPSVAFVARGGARKVALLRRVQHATVTFRHGWEWVAADGPVRIAGPDDPLAGVDPSEVPALLRAVFRAAGGTHDDWDEYDRVMAAERRAAVFVRPDRILTNG